MFLLGLIVSTCFVPGLTGAAIPTQWAFLSVALPFSLWRHGAFGPGHLLGLLGLAYAALSIFWARNYLDGLDGLWYLSILALAFWLGSTTYEFERLFKGLAVGLSVSSVIAISQWLGYHPVEAMSAGEWESLQHTAPAGLFFNPTLLGATAAVVIIGLAEFELYWWIPSVVPSLLLSHSRGAWIILAIGLLIRRIHWSILLALGLATIYVLVLTLTQSDSQRLYLWSIAIQNLTTFGNGLGSFSSIYYMAFDLLFHSPVRMVHPEYLHNDYLQLVFELGLGSLPIFAVLGLALSQHHHTGWATLVALCCLALFYFPLHTPLLGFLTAMLAGRFVASWHLTRPHGVSWRPYLLPRGPYWPRRADAMGPEAFPSRQPS